ncbi:TonB-dependent receptor [Gaoshiqia sediminis]|uniref:TonB-dependent receptor n=1 Tax=Gaoshiqia sediminis TaxID=2986998 RepID=A0AA41Y9D4_9BACT|nr:TonB-dependent receptor [Gaoshiqia sediminis]MCW0481823.1 TonB-dependent receptor [Gaoshiqia sediminis]
MKLTTLISLCFVITAAANSYSQSTKLNLKLSNSSVKEILNQIETESEYVFLYNLSEMDENRKVDIDLENATITEVLDEILKGQHLTYSLYDRQVIIRADDQARQSTQSVQPQTASGKVTSTSGEPIPGVTVVVLGTNTGTITDLDGSFTLSNVTPGSVLVFSFVGMVSQEVSFEGQAFLNVKLAEETIGIEEVVAIGYGTMRKSDLTGAITQVKSDELAAASVSNPIQALQGRASGVAVLTNNAPGSSPTLRVRGSGSINAGNDPLYVVDGFPLINNDLNDINPNDIASMEILKDASSSAIYGSRGANGVVLITTKKGQQGKNNLSVNSYFGIQTPERLVDMLDQDEFIEYVNEAYTYSKGAPVYSSTNPAPAYNTDWQDAIVRDQAVLHEHSITFDGGNDRTNYLLSGGVFSQTGLLPASGFEKYTFRNNLTHKFSNWLTVGSHMNFSHAVQNVRDNPTGNIFRFGWPTMPTKNEDGSWYYSFLDPQHDSYIEGRWNPVADAQEVTDERTRNRILGDVFAEFTLHKNLKFKTNIGVDMSNSKGYQYETSRSSAGLSSGGKGVGGQSYNKMTSLLSESMLTYSNVWNDVHRFTAVGVYSYQDYEYDVLSISGSGFDNDATGAYDMNLATREGVRYSSNKYGNKLISWTARASYVYNDRYMITATGRYDGSSRFGENNKWGFFPSLGLGWTVSQESFLIDNPVLTNLKLRASFGITGNQEISNYASLPKLTSANYVYNSVLMPGYTESIGNPDLSWERTTQIDLGMEVGLWNIFDINFDYYQRTTNDLLYNVPIPTTSGFSSILNNIGEVQNNGVELSVFSKILDGELKWSVGANVTYNKNEITELYGDVEKITLGTSSNGYARFLEIGKPVNAVYTRESAGIIRTQEQLDEYRKIRSTANLGEEMYVDHTGNNSIGTDDYICIGSPEPKFFYGFSTNASYKNFTLEVYGQGAHDYASVAGIDNSAFGGTSLVIGYATSTDSYLMYGENQILNQNYQPSQYAYDRMWSESNPNGSFPRAGAKDVYFSDRTSANWSYFILKNIKLGYDFTPMIKNVNWIKQLNVYVNMQNYFNRANHRGYNPENGDTTYPWAKSMIFGVNVKF